MLSNIGISKLLLILIVALIVFGPSKLPENRKAISSSLREFKKASDNILSYGRSSI